MHATELESGRTVHRNGDYSGEVRVGVTADEVTLCADGSGYVELPFTDLRELVTDYLRGRLIELLEDAGPEELERYLLGGRR